MRAAATLIEQRARSAEGPTVLLGSVGPDGLPQGERVRRFASMAEHSTLVTLFGVGTALPRGVRGASLADDDPLRSEWDVALVGPHVAAALVARPSGDGEMEYAVVYDRDLVMEVARALMSRTVPRPARRCRAWVAAHQPRSRHSGSYGRSVPSVVSSPWPG